ncbi:helix-turn-helix domain-containing protein [Kitasatospora indigofera]|uniref:helix-turn-helix domain-containing protein n=1 Tax=Kitasatospora indigofera TaxID=67307 RepID=UPI00369E8066
MTETKKTSLGPTGDQVRANVARLRSALGLSKKDLSDRVAALGRPIPPLGITRLEAGTRRVDADDLMALSLALGVSPVTLLLPVNARGETEVTGAGSVSSHAAWMWAWCSDPLTLPEGEEEANRATTEFLLNSRPIGLFFPQGDDRLAPWAPRRRQVDGQGLD